MNLMFLALVLFMSSFNFAQGKVNEKSKLFLHQVGLEVSDSGDVLIEFDVPCGGSFYGVVAQEHYHAGRRYLEIGVAIRERSVRCAGSDVPASMTTGIFSGDRYDEVRSWVGAGSEPLVLAETYEIAVEKGQVFGLVEDVCSAYRGALIKAQDFHMERGSLRVGVVHQDRSSTAKKSCQKGPVVRELFKIGKNSNFVIESINEKTPILRSFFDMKLRSVKDQRGDTLKFVRACDEVPLGLAESLDGQHQIHIVVVRNRHLKCADKNRQMSYGFYPVHMFPQERRDLWKFTPADDRKKMEA